MEEERRRRKRAPPRDRSSPFSPQNQSIWVSSEFNSRRLDERFRYEFPPIEKINKDYPWIFSRGDELKNKIAEYIENKDPPHPIAYDLPHLLRTACNSFIFNLTNAPEEIAVLMYAAMLHDIDKEKEDHGEAAAETAEPWLEEILPTRYMINIREDILAIVSKHEEFKREFILSKILKRDISDIFKGLPLSLLGAHYVADVSSRADMDRFTVYTYENTVLEENHKDIDDVYSVKWEVEKNRFGPGERALLSLYEPWMHHCIEIYKDIEKVGPKALEDLYNMSYDSLLHDKKRYKKMTLLEICNELRFDLKPLEYPLLDPNGDIS